MRYRLLGTVEQVMDDEIEVEGITCCDGFPKKNAEKSLTKKGMLTKGMLKLKQLLSNNDKLG